VEEHLKSSKFLTVGIELKILVECEFLRPKIEVHCYQLGLVGFDR